MNVKTRLLYDGSLEILNRVSEQVFQVKPFDKGFTVSLKREKETLCNTPFDTFNRNQYDIQAINLLRRDFKTYPLMEFIADIPGYVRHLARPFNSNDQLNLIRAVAIDAEIGNLLRTHPVLVWMVVYFSYNQPAGALLNNMTLLRGDPVNCLSGLLDQSISESDIDLMSRILITTYKPKEIKLICAFFTTEHESKALISHLRKIPFSVIFYYMTQFTEVKIPYLEKITHKASDESIKIAASHLFQELQKIHKMNNELEEGYMIFDTMEKHLSQIGSAESLDTLVLKVQTKLGLEKNRKKRCVI